MSKDKDFDRVFKTGQSFYSPILGIRAAKNGLLYNRFGILISAKVSKKAIERNKLRRRLRAIINQENDLLRAGWDLVFIALPAANKKNFTDIKANIKLIFVKLKLYVKKRAV